MEHAFLTGNNTKAGVPERSREQIDEIILQASKGYRFFLHQEKRKQQVIERAAKMKERTFPQTLLAQATVEVDAFLDSLRKESEPKKSVYVHVDMDAFFAAVEELHRPNLKNVPMAVGNDAMLSTANYAARKYGVSAGMPGFIARKLCPEIVLVDLNYDRYVAASELVQAVFKEYDPNFNSFSLDEASLNFTDLVQEGTAEDIAREMREKVKGATGLTCSAGIGPTRQLAKMASNMNKPDGQFSLFTEVDGDLLGWLRKQPVKRISGVGKVTTALLQEAFGVKTIGDIYEKRAEIWLKMTRKQAEFLVSASCGLAGSMYDGADEDNDGGRKSMSVERTYFPPLDNIDEMSSKLRLLSEYLAKDLENEQVACCCVSIKVKLANFTVLTRSHSVKKRIQSALEIFKISEDLLKRVNPKDARLLGVRASGLESTKPTSLDEFLAQGAEYTGEVQMVPCPICGLTVTESSINDHLDLCLCNESLKEEASGNQSKAKKMKKGPMDAFVGRT